MKRYYFFFLSIFFLINLSCSNFLSDEELQIRYEKALSKNDWKNLLPILDEIIKRNPKDQNVYFSRAIARTNINPDNLDEIIEDLTKHLEINNNQDVKALYIRFQAYGISKKFNKALKDINKIIELKGKNSFLLSWKANCAFAAKEFDVAEESYSERLKLSGTYEDLKKNYYYLIFSKYFKGNKKGALWDCAFLPDRGFKEDHELMKLIGEDKLVFEKLANFEIPSLTLEQLELLLSNDCKGIDIFKGKNYFRSELLEELAHLERIDDVKDLLPQKENVYALNLRYTNLRELPKEIFQFINLQALDISGNKFEDKEKLFEDLVKLPNLKILSLGRCNLKKLPDNISLLENIEALVIYANGFREINENIRNLKKLKLLDLSNNSLLNDLPKYIGELRCLQRLDVSGSGLIRLREELSNCNELVSISANASNIRTLPNNIGNLINLKHLNLAANNIKELPKSIGDLESLNDLSLSSNNLERLPNEISKLKNLGSINLYYNRFKEFPKELLKMENLYSIWIHNNSIKKIPVEVAKMPNIERILVDHEVITDENIRMLKDVNPSMYVIREDSRKYVKGKKRKD